jgi:hypothetical protein
MTTARQQLNDLITSLSIVSRDVCNIIVSYTIGQRLFVLEHDQSLHTCVMQTISLSSSQTWWRVPCGGQLSTYWNAHPGHYKESHDGNIGNMSAVIIPHPSLLLPIASPSLSSLSSSSTTMVESKATLTHVPAAPSAPYIIARTCAQFGRPANLATYTIATNTWSTERCYDLDSHMEGASTSINGFWYCAGNTFALFFARTSYSMYVIAFSSYSLVLLTGGMMGAPASRVARYDPITKQWTNLNRLPIPFGGDGNNASALCTNGWYLFGNKGVMLYTHESDTWSIVDTIAHITHPIHVALTLPLRASGDPSARTKVVNDILLFSNSQRDNTYPFRLYNTITNTAKELPWQLPFDGSFRIAQVVLLTIYDGTLCLIGSTVAIDARSTGPRQYQCWSMDCVHQLGLWKQLPSLIASAASVLVPLGAIDDISHL